MAVETLELTENLYQYLLDISVRECEIAKNLREATQKLAQGRMQSSPDQANFLALLVKLMGAKHIIEVGTFTGYATLHMATALPDDGKIITCDINEETVAIGKPFWQQAGVEHKINCQIAPALDTLQGLLDHDCAERFDMVFIDANKTNYPHYYDLCLQLVRTGGLIVFDNVLWKGKVIDSNHQDNMTKAIREVNQRLSSDERVDISLVPMGDGLFLARKR